MSSLFQTVSALVLVAAALAWLAARALAKRSKPGCGGDCGCSAAPFKDKVRSLGRTPQP